MLGTPAEKAINVLDTDASVVAISGILHQEQEWNGKAVLRPIAYGSKVLSDTEKKYGAPKAERFTVVTFVEKYRAFLGSEPSKLRVDNRALSRLKTYSMDQSYIGRWIVRLDGYNMIIEQRTSDKHQNADSLSKNTEFYERQYDSLPRRRWLDKSGKPIEDHSELPVEHEAKEILKRNSGMPMEMMLKSKIVRETLKAKGYDLNEVENEAKEILKRNSRMPMEMMLKSKIVSETLKAKGCDLDEVETRRVTKGEDLMRLLGKLADDKPVIRNNG